MNDKAIAYLEKNSLLHMGMIEPIRRGTADILYAERDGVLMKEQKSNAYMISVNSFEKGCRLINKISRCSLIAAHQKYMADYIFSKFKLAEKVACVQAVYTDKTKLYINEELKIKQLGENQAGIILDNYDKLSADEIKELLKMGNLFGGYKDEALVGFIGSHLEGSIGLLNIFPEYRRLGYGTILESYMVNKMLEKSLVPFGQIETNNQKSMALQSKLGFKISKDKLYWMC